MRVQDLVSTKALAITHNEVASNKIAYLGEAFFPNKKKLGVDLKSIRTGKGLPVSLNPSAYDAVSAIRSREGFKIDEKEMAFFKESMLVKEKDKIDLMRIADANDPFALEIYENIFNDFETLYESADVVAERMRMQLLSSDNGHPSISLVGDGATYAYNYDPDNDYSSKNYEALAGGNLWTAHSTAKPITDIKRWKKALRKSRGVNAKYVLMNDATFDNMVACDEVKNYILAQTNTLTVVADDDIAQAVIEKATGLTILSYEKMFKDESGNDAYFYKEGFVALLPEGPLGNTYYGSTPEEIEMINGGVIDTTVVDNKVTVSVVHTVDPAQDKTVVSEVLLPSFEQILSTYTAKVYTPS